MERTEERISELKDRTIETIQSWQQRKNRLSQAREASGTVTKHVALTSSESGKERTNWVWLKSTQRRNGKKCPYVEKTNLHDSRSWVNPKQGEPKGPAPRHIMIKHLETKGKKLPWKSWEGNDSTYRRKTVQMASGSSSDAIGAVAHFSSAEKNDYQPIILYPGKISFRNLL